MSLERSQHGHYDYCVIYCFWASSAQNVKVDSIFFFKFGYPSEGLNLEIEIWIFPVYFISGNKIMRLRAWGI